MSLLATLLGPLSPADAVAALEERRLLHVPCGGGERLARLFGWSSFAELMNLYPLASADLRVTKNGQPVPSDWLAGHRGNEMIDGAAFRKLAEQGASVILNRLEQRSAVHRALWREAVEIFKSGTQIASIATFRKGRALKPHYDAVDLVIVQIAGCKEWEFFGEPREVCDDGDKKVSEDLAASSRLTLRPGDVLVVPRGLAHRCHGEDSCLHLGLLIKRPHAADYLRWLAQRADKLPELHARLSFEAGPEAAARDDAALRKALAWVMEHHSPSDYLDQYRRRLEVAPVVADDFPGSLE